MIRSPAVAGQFYSASKDDLEREISALIGRRRAEKKEDAIGVISPHAGYIYSGPVAAATLASINPKSNYIIMGPNHTGLGSQFSVSTSDSWGTPLGEVKINKDIVQKVLKNCDLISQDELSHTHEHSIEVQLPFLQSLQDNFLFAPIVISLADIDAYKKIGASLAKAIRDLKIEKDTAIIASSDMTHYEPQDTARTQDFKAIEAILNLDEDALVERVETQGISMCGFAPTAIMIAASKSLGARSGRLIKYQTSGDVSGDYSSVVGYAGIIVN